MANVIGEVAKRAGRRLLLVQVSQLTGGVSIHRVGRGGATAFARYANAVRAHVEEVHALANVGGIFGAAVRGLLTTITKFGPNPSVLHENVDAMVEHLRARHGVDPAALKAAIAKVVTAA